MFCRLFKALLVLAAVVYLLLGLWWIVVASLVVLGFLWLFSTSWVPVKRIMQKDIIRVPLKIVLIYSAIVLSRLLFFELIGVPMTSMQDTIKPGDMIYVSRLRYGPPLPSNPYEITWFNILLYSIERDKADFKRQVWKRRRLKGYGNPRINDIVVFAQPPTGDYFIKRCLGTPGDTVEILNGTVYVNGSEVREPATIVKGKGPAYGWRIYPGRHTGWDPDNWGPFVIPSKGMEMTLDSAALAVYGRLLKEHEGYYPPRPSLKTTSDEASKAEVYTFKFNYYFYVGDNRPRSNDSRFSGPVPEINIIGKAQRILLNTNSDIPILSRLMVPLNRKKYFAEP